MHITDLPRLLMFAILGVWIGWEIVSIEVTSGWVQICISLFGLIIMGIAMRLVLSLIAAAVVVALERRYPRVIATLTKPVWKTQSNPQSGRRQ